MIIRILKDLRLNPSRLRLEWVSAAEGSRYVTLITSFTESIRELGHLGSSEDLDLEHLALRLKATKMALEGKRLRMVIARQAKYLKEGDTYREIPLDHKLSADLAKTLAEETASQEMLLHLLEKPRSVDELAKLLDITSENVIDYFKKLERKRLVDSDRLVFA